MARVSVVLPTYNRAHCLAAAVHSVLSQTYQDWELIIVDDGSTDGTPEILSDIPCKRMNFIRLDVNRGNSAARNIGAQHASGAIIAALDSDDIWLPHHLSAMVRRLDDDKTLSLVSGRSMALTDDGSFVQHYGAKADRQQVRDRLLIMADCLVQTTTVMRREHLDAVGGYDEGVRSATDYALWVRLRRMGLAMENIGLTTAISRLTAGSVSRTNAAVTEDLCISLCAREIWAELGRQGGPADCLNAMRYYKGRSDPGHRRTAITVFRRILATRPESPIFHRALRRVRIEAPLRLMRPAWRRFVPEATRLKLSWT